MKRLLLVIFLLLPIPASAQFNGCPAGFCFPKTGGVAPTYQGPGDVQSGFQFFRSCFAFSAAKAGTKAYNVTRASDSTSIDVNSLANGSCDTTTPVTFCASTTCVMFYYDQSGANACGGVPCDGNAAFFPSPWGANVQNGMPCSTNASGSLTANGTRYGLSNFNLSAPYTVGGVSERIGSTGANSRMMANSSGSVTLGYTSSANTARATGGSITATASDNAFHSLIMSVISTAGASALVVDGTAATGTITSTAYSSQTIEEYADQVGTSAVPMAICETYIINTNIGSGAYGPTGTLQANIKIRWNTP